MKLFVTLFTIGVALVPQRGFGQGCLLTRNMSPILGAQISPY